MENSLNTRQLINLIQDDLVTAGTIAERFGVSQVRISDLCLYYDFPKPVIVRGRVVRLFSWREVCAWKRARVAKFGERKIA